MKKIIPFLAVLLFTTTAHAARLNHEAINQNKWCAEIGGAAEKRLPDKSHIDCLTAQYAIEFNFADKWAEAIGKARLYANITRREPGIVLIMEDKERNFKFLVRLLKAIYGDPKHWSVWIVEPVVSSSAAIHKQRKKFPLFKTHYMFKTHRKN